MDRNSTVLMCGNGFVSREIPGYVTVNGSPAPPITEPPVYNLYFGDSLPDCQGAALNQSLTLGNALDLACSFSGENTVFGGRISNGDNSLEMQMQIQMTTDSEDLAQYKNGPSSFVIAKNYFSLAFECVDGKAHFENFTDLNSAMVKENFIKSNIDDISRKLSAYEAVTGVTQNLDSSTCFQ